MKLLPLSFVALCCCMVVQAQNLAYTPAQEKTILIAAPVINEMNQATIADSFNVWVDVLNTINPEIKNELYHIQSRGFRLNYYQKTKKQNVKCGTEDKSGNTYFGGVNSLIANASLTGLVIKVNANGWSIPGKGIMGSICNALTNDPSGNIYAGGVFSKLGKITVSNKYSTIAKFDGRKWTQLGSQLKGHVYRMYTDKLGRIYVCGNFSVKNDSTLQYLVRWNGSAWEGLGEGLNGPVFATYYSEEGLVYACGSFTASGTGSTAYEKTNRTLAFFDGAEWKPLPGGTTINKGAYIDAMLIKDNALYVRGGGIDSINGKPVSSTGPQEINFLKYQFPTATDLGGFNGNVYTMEADDDGNIYVGGYFTAVGDENLTANNIAQWDGKKWLALGSGLTGDCTDIDIDAFGNVYAAGDFVTAGGDTVNYVAMWDGSKWNALGKGLSSPAFTLTIDANSKVYVGGSFNKADTVAVNNIAVWDIGTSTWSAMGKGLNASCEVLETDQYNYVYAGGGFGTAGGKTAESLAKWSIANKEWSDVGSGVSNGNGVLGLYYNENDKALYVSGNFLKAGNTSVSHIAKWNGSRWSSISGAPDNLSATAINNVTVDEDGNVYIGGYITKIGATSVSNAAYYNASSRQWKALDGNFNAPVQDIYTDGKYLFIGGNFTQAFGTSASHFVRNYIE